MQSKVAFDTIASAVQSIINVPFTFNGLTYTLFSCVSVTGPYSDWCQPKGNIYNSHEIVPSGVDALVFRYSVSAGNGKGAINKNLDLRVLTSINIPDNATTTQLVSYAKQFLEDAR
jgi:hypothetical protein